MANSALVVEASEWRRVEPGGFKKQSAGIALTVGAKACSFRTNALDAIKQDRCFFLEIAVNEQAKQVRIRPSSNHKDFTWPIAKNASWRSLWVELQALGVQMGRYEGRVESGAILIDCARKPQPLLCVTKAPTKKGDQS